MDTSFEKPTYAAQQWLRQLMRVRNLMLVRVIENTYALTSDQKADLLKTATNMEKISAALEQRDH
jgi:hypothetical protein